MNMIGSRVSRLRFKKERLAAAPVILFQGKYSPVVTWNRELGFDQRFIFRVAR
jgi:hypothetical protein